MANILSGNHQPMKQGHKGNSSKSERNSKEMSATNLCQASGLHSLKSELAFPDLLGRTCTCYFSGLPLAPTWPCRGQVLGVMLILPELWLPLRTMCGFIFSKISRKKYALSSLVSSSCCYGKCYLGSWLRCQDFPEEMVSPGYPPSSPPARGT